MAYTDAQGTNNSIRSNKTYSDLNLNFTKNPATNDVARLTDVEAVKRAVRNLILTNQTIQTSLYLLEIYYLFITILMKYLYLLRFNK